MTISEPGTRRPGKSASLDPDLEDAIREYLRTYVLWRGIGQATETFGVSRHTLWRFLERGHTGRALPRAVLDTVGDSVEVLETATWAIAAAERVVASRPAVKPVLAPYPMSQARGYYYLVTVMDDYSRFIIAHRLQRDMTSDSFIEVVQEAVDRTGMDQVPITDRTRLLSDNGPGYVSRAFRDYLGMVGIRHILAAPFHPQTNGKLERYHQTLKRDVNQLPYEMPSDLEAAIVAFVSYYNYRRYHKALGNVTPSDVLRGRREDILRRRREVKAQTIEHRRQHNKALRELTRPQSDPMISRVSKCATFAGCQQSRRLERHSLQPLHPRLLPKAAGAW